MNVLSELKLLLATQQFILILILQKRRYLATFCCQVPQMQTYGSKACNSNKQYFFFPNPHYPHHHHIISHILHDVGCIFFYKSNSFHYHPSQTCTYPSKRSSNLPTPMHQPLYPKYKQHLTSTTFNHPHHHNTHNHTRSIHFLNQLNTKFIHHHNLPKNHLPYKYILKLVTAGGMKLVCEFLSRSSKITCRLRNIFFLKFSHCVSKSIFVHSEHSREGER